LSPLYNCIKTNEKSVEKERTLGSWKILIYIDSSIEIVNFPQ
jgi:hypothetical protein